MFWLMYVGMPAMAADLLVGAGQPHATIADAAAVAASGDRILVDPGTYPEDTIDVTGLDLTIEPSGGPGTVVVELVNGVNLFEVSGGATLTVIDLELDAAGVGRVLEASASTVHFEGSILRNGTAPNGGAAGGTMSVVDATLILSNTILDTSVGPVKNGGHVHSTRSVLNIFTTTFSRGDGRAGGGISAYDASTVYVEDSTFTSNAANTGSAIYVEDSELNLLSSTLVDNAANDGTVFCRRGAECSVAESVFQGNTGNSGAVLVADAPTVTSLLSVVQCGAPAGHSHVDLVGTSATVVGSVFYDNVLSSQLIRVGVGTDATLINNHFVGATSTGSGAAARVEGDLTFVNNLVAYNTGSGPALDLAGGTVTESYNAWFANTTADASFALDPTDLVGVDPLIAVPVPGSCDLAGLVPPAGSPLVDAGDPAILDADGSVSDIGAYGGGTPVGTTDADLDGVPAPLDCDDNDPTVFPGQTEVHCNGVDDDCDPGTEDDPDADGDLLSVCAGDCDDTDPDVYPGAVEVECNLIDDDCDPATLDGVDADGDGASYCIDCDDNDPARSPDFTEIRCNGIDDDCDAGTIDEDADDDGDGISVCSGDCDDTDPNVYPGAPELECNSVDDDCDPATVDAPDGDGDGASVCVDCDDADPARSPNFLEIRCNGIDDDCDPGTIDEDADADADGVSVCDGDCDDNDPNAYPGAPELVCNGTDDDCDAATLDAPDGDGDGASVCVDCDDADPARSPDQTEIGCNGIDDDCDPGTTDADADADADGVSVCAGDCDDGDADVYPGALEVLCNGVDDDCDPTTLDGEDADGDGIGVCAGDCDDADPDVYPGAVEIDCNGVDDDCDPNTTEGVDEDLDGVSSCTDCDDTDPERSETVVVYLDQDLDDYGTGQAYELCGMPVNAALANGDCDDDDPTINPGAAEIPYDGIDQDCDGADLEDLDGDGYDGAEDCDDNDPGRYPFAEEIPGDGIDQNCNGSDATSSLVGGAGVTCGCQSAPSHGGLWWAAVLLPWMRRRRRSGSAPRV